MTDDGVADISLTRERHRKGERPGSRIASVIRQARAELGMTQAEFAARTGSTQSQVSALERGWVVAPSYERMQAYARALQVPLDELIRRSGWAGAPLAAVGHTAVDAAWQVGPDPVAELIEVARDLPAADVVTLVRLARVLRAGRAGGG